MGFALEWKEGKVRPYAFLKHPRLPNVSLDLFQGAAKITAYFGTKESAKSEPKELLQILNKLNREAGAAKFYLDRDGDFTIEAVFPATYSKLDFGAYWLILERDLQSIYETDMGSFL